MTKHNSKNTTNTTSMNRIDIIFTYVIFRFIIFI